MKGVELYGRVRYAVQIEGLSHRAGGEHERHVVLCPKVALSS